MKKLLFIVTYSIINLCITLNAMETAPVILGQKHIVKFLTIVKQNHSFEKAVPFIKQLTEHKSEWKQILNDAQSTGELIQCAYENYEKHQSNTTKSEMSYLLATPGALEWGKNFLRTNSWELKCLQQRMLIAAERNDCTTISTLLNMGIDVNSTDPGSLDDGGACCIGGFNPMLISAIERSNFNLVKFLLVEKEANPNIRANKDEATPLIMSIQLLQEADKNKSYEKFHALFSITCLLMKHSLLDVAAVDTNNKKAFDYALEYDMNWLTAMIALDNFFNI